MIKKAKFDVLLRARIRSHFTNNYTHEIVTAISLAYTIYPSNTLSVSDTLLGLCLNI